MIIRACFYFILLSALSVLLAEPSLSVDLSLASSSGFAHYLLVFELLLIAALFPCISKLEPKKSTGLCFLFILIALFHISTQGRAILSAGLFIPGSPGERLLWPLLSLSFDRLLEPGLWAVGLVFLFIRNIKTKNIKTLIPIISIILSVFLEVVFLVGTKWLQPLESILVVIHFLLIQIAILLTLANLIELKEKSPKLLSKELFTKRLLAFSSSLIVVPFLLVLFSGLFIKKEELMVGAYYYSWFPENWKGGFSGQKFSQAVEPSEGLYRSANKELFLKHVAQAQEAEIDFFIFDWWPGRRDVRNKFDHHIKESLGELKFALHYETLDLLTLRKKKELKSNIITIEDEDIFQATKHFEHLAKNYFSHPNYLKIDEKPVVFMYATRHLVGDTSDFINRIREHLRETFGLEIYLVGDEVFENVISQNRSGEAILKAAYKPDWQRLLSFDAVTSYNPYDPASSDYEGVDVNDAFREKLPSLYRKYSKLAEKSNLNFIPTALPGYDDRALRALKNHPPLFRERGEFFKWFLSEAKKFVDPKLGIMTITSWNEWNEGTQIEPAKASANSLSKDGALLTASYEAYHGRYLEEIKKLKSSVIISDD